MFACLFDIDGTLLASGGAGKHALETALTEDFAVPLRGQIPYSGRTDRAIVRDLFHLHEIPHDEDNVAKLFAGYLRRLPTSLNIRRGHVLPGIIGLLNHLRAQDHIALGLLTGNVRAGASMKLGHFGLFEHFRFGGFGDNHFDRDDVAREALDSVRQHLGHGFPVERIWVIGDTPLDVRCARAIGAQVAAVATGIHDVRELAAANPDLVFQNLEDALPFLNRLAAAP